MQGGPTATGGAWARRNNLSFTARYVSDVSFDYPFLSPVTVPATTDVDTESIVLGQSETPDSTVWDAAVALSAFLCHSPLGTEIRGKRVMELGSGCGLVGIVAYKLGANVVVTDMEDYMPLLRKNVERNCPGARQFEQSSEGETGSISAELLEWGSNTHNHHGYGSTFDYILGSDIVYALQGFEELAESLLALSDSHTRIYLAYEHRWRDVEGYFFEVVTPHFKVTEVEQSQHHPYYSTPIIRIFLLQLPAATTTAT
eukprot:TRINITY_DN10053_c0_g1_i1.p1 TRINITY_DN10053_c0_g1~~TRINITY_DN10053_c0_g1_i1.p1  ORF type:complete len:257 (+),score=25.95 TRINITY_DN10053_c0_g1_i1:78-848(+)